GTIPTYAEVRGTPWKYNEYQTGESELYDEIDDAFELNNVVTNPANADTVIALAARLRELRPGWTATPSGAFVEPYDRPTRADRRARSAPRRRARAARGAGASNRLRRTAAAPAARRSRRRGRRCRTPRPASLRATRTARAARSATGQRIRR